MADSGYRYYSQEQLHHFLGIKSEAQLNKMVIGYCRVGSHKQKGDLERQIDNVKIYMLTKVINLKSSQKLAVGLTTIKKD